jgi:hypothetical protein
MTIPDCLLIGIKEGKIEILGQGGQTNMIILAKKKKKENPTKFDKMIITDGAVLNV